MIKYLEKESDFEKLVSEGNVIVDFYADWCGPCKLMGEVLENVKDINVVKVNTDKFEDLAFSFGIMSIPTLIRFEDGKEAEKRIGLQSKEELIEFSNSGK